MLVIVIGRKSLVAIPLHRRIAYDSTSLAPGAVGSVRARDIEAAESRRGVVGSSAMAEVA